LASGINLSSSVCNAVCDISDGGVFERKLDILNPVASNYCGSSKSASHNNDALGPELNFEKGILAKRRPLLDGLGNFLFNCLAKRLWLTNHPRPPVTYPGMLLLPFLLPYDTWFDDEFGQLPLDTQHTITALARNTAGLPKEH
jgi:hypothetical protein